jgi:RNA polymerase sigma-54 factor
LTPQQVQYLQLLQLPLLALEQRIKAELEQNPLLEETDENESTQEQEDVKTEEEVVPTNGEQVAERDDHRADHDKYTFEDFMNDELDGHKATQIIHDDEERDDFPQAAEVTLIQKLHDQVLLLDLNEEEKILAYEIIGNIDEDGYLRRDLSLIVQDLNLGQNLSIPNERAEEVLKMIQRLDPPGICSRSLQECLVVQLEVGDYDPMLRSQALRVLSECFEDFAMKHYEELAKELGIDLDRLRPVIELIQKLNPKPGEGEFTPHQNYILPDFIVERTDDEFIITLNDRNVPPLRINKRYKELMSRRQKGIVATGVKDFIRKRFEAAKWFINSINQRRDTMMRVMRAILEKQRVFFETGEHLRPMIYKDIAEVVEMDISTISRVVNGKYVQTEYGVFELRHFFSDKLTTQSGEEVSNKEVKIMIKEIIEQEDSNRPLSDDRIAEMLNTRGLNIARRTVAKYREAMHIPVARLRRKL